MSSMASLDTLEAQMSGFDFGQFAEASNSFFNSAPTMGESTGPSHGFSGSILVACPKPAFQQLCPSAGSR